MPIRSREDATEVESRIERIFAAGTSSERAAEIRGLFVEVLDFDAAAGHVDLGGTPAGATLPASAERVAALDGVHVAYVALDTPETDRVRKSEAAAAAKRIADQLDGDLLLVFTNTSASQLHFIYPSFQGAQPVLRRLVAEQGLPHRTAVQQISNIYWKYRDTSNLHLALEEAFDVEPVTRDFFREYKRVFEAAEQRVTGFGEDDEGKRRFVQTLFNRLMFIYFLSRKGWLTFKDDKDYLNALWRDYRAAEREDKNFYRDRLRALFFAGLNNPQSRDLMRDNPVMHALIGDVPFLNGGLFERTEQDRHDGVTVPDTAIESILGGLFDRFNFTVMEATPFDVEVAVDPEMLGKVFEELVTGRHDSGAYYTPRPVVSFMCREALKGYLEGQDTGVAPEAIARFVDDRDTAGVSVASAPNVARALNEVTVVDPACGSGAYLLGMMQELVELQTALFDVSSDQTGLYDLKLHVIQRNLYGVDIDDFAVNIAMLRLWLSLAIEFEGDDPPPLPNLDFKVLRGDSLLGPDPSLGSYGDLFRHRAHQVSAHLVDAKARHMAAATGKDAHRAEVERIQAELREALADSPAPQGATDWRVEFAEVFDRGGFDIAIANPPYIHLRWHGDRMRQLYRNAGFVSYARMGDIYQLFYERGCQLLRANSGLLSYISSNSWMKAEYGKRLRRFFSEHTPLQLLELGKDVFESAIVDSAVLILRVGREGKGERSFPAVDVDKMVGDEFPPSNVRWGQVRARSEGPWVILSTQEQSVMDKMYTRGTALKDWDVETYIGTMTGYNKAFLVDTETKEALIARDAKAVNILKPVLRGRDIQRYCANWAGLWLIDVHNGYGSRSALDVSEYPTIKAHLDKYYSELQKRYDQGRTPYNLRSCAYHEEFSKEKLFWMDLTERGRFAYSGSEMFCLNTASMLIGPSIKYLCAVLNSSLITWLMKSTALNSGMGVPRWIRTTVERIPIPRITADEERPFVRLVDRILAAKATDPSAETSVLEAELDRMVYALYGLTEEERAAAGG